MSPHPAPHSAPQPRRTHDLQRCLPLPPDPSALEGGPGGTRPWPHLSSCRTLLSSCSLMAFSSLLSGLRFLFFLLQQQQQQQVTIARRRMPPITDMAIMSASKFTADAKGQSQSQGCLGGGPPGSTSPPHGVPSQSHQGSEQSQGCLEGGPPGSNTLTSPNGVPSHIQGPGEQLTHSQHSDSVS